MSVRALVVAFAVLAATGCSRNETSTAKGTRVVSLSPSTTEAMFAIGAVKEMVGRSRYCDHPPEVLALPQVGGYVDPSFEAILALAPTLVVGARGPTGTALTDKLAERSIATYFPKAESLAEIRTMIEGLGAKTGHVEGARAVVAKMDARVAEVEESVKGLPKVRVLLVFGVEPLSVAGPKSFPDEMIARAGGANVVTEGGAYPMLGFERVLALDPDVIVAAIMSEPRAAERIAKDKPGWSGVRAVKEGHVVPLTDETILRPGPRIGEGLAALARALHPEAKP